MSAPWCIGFKINDDLRVFDILGGPGKSGMGIVYVVLDHKERSVHALKTIQERLLSRSPGLADRFRTEALAWVNLDSHPNVVRARTFQTLERRPFLFLEWVSGGDLSRWIGSGRLRKDLPQILRFAVQLCDGMEHILSKGIAAHRDIKPSNCLITEDMTLKVTDFGLSKVYSEIDPDLAPNDVCSSHPCSHLSLTGAGLGTPYYMAPEQFADAKHVDMRADIYSFGVVIHEMISGIPPFQGRHWQELERSHRVEPIPPLQLAITVERSVRTELEAIVGGCLAKEPQRRIQDFGQLRRRLSTLIEDLTGRPIPGPIQSLKLQADQWFNKGMSLRALGRVDDALKCYETGLKLDATSATGWYNKAIGLEAAKRTEEAIEAYDVALRIDPQMANAWTNKARLLWTQNRIEEASRAYETANQINPRDALAWIGKARLLLSQGQRAQALVAIEAAARCNGQNDEAWISTGNVFSELKLGRQAMNGYDRALELNPNNAAGWYNKGNQLRDAGRLYEALAAYDYATSIAPQLELAWLNKGHVLTELGRFEEAILAQKHYLEIKPMSGLMYFEIAANLVRLQRFPSALNAIEDGLRIEPADKNAWVLKAHLLKHLDRKEDAVVALKEAVGIDGVDALNWFDIGELYLAAC